MGKVGLRLLWDGWWVAGGGRAPAFPYETAGAFDIWGETYPARRGGPRSCGGSWWGAKSRWPHARSSKPHSIANLKVCTRKLQLPLIAACTSEASCPSDVHYANVPGKIWLETDRQGSVGQDVALMVTDGGKPYFLNNPFKPTEIV
jgi:hypothetical protein